MKKLLFFIPFIYFLFVGITVSASEPSTISFSDFVNSYGVSGARDIVTFATNPQKTYSVISSESPVLIVRNSSRNNFMCVSENPFVLNMHQYNDQTLNINTNPRDFSYFSANLPSGYFTDTSGSYYVYIFSSTSSIVTASPDIDFDGSLTDWNTWLTNNPNSPNNPNNLGGLPVLTYTANTSIIYRITYGFDKKGIITWDFNEKEPYKSNPSAYCVDFTVSGHLDSGWHLTSDLSIDDLHKVVLSSGGCSVAQNKFDWIYQKTGLEFYKTYDSSVNKFPYHDNNAQGQAEGYRVYVRTRNVNTNEASAWKIFNYIGGVFSSAGYAQDDSDPNNPEIKPLGPDNSDNDDYTPHFDKDNSTDAEADPTGQNYNGNIDYNPATLFNNLKSAINSLSELPQMASQVVTFMPEWLVSLIFISIGLLVVVGLVKTILN